MLPASLKARIEKFGANLLEVRRVHVVADEDEFIEFNEELNRAQAQSDDRKLLKKLLVGQESLKRKLVDMGATNRDEYKSLKRYHKETRTRICLKPNKP